ncbi:MAG: hypothetical protein JWM58_1689 [Rhizobium sp.]|nr:hypothetical protein [Rhizobium sp.]
MRLPGRLGPGMPRIGDAVSTASIMRGSQVKHTVLAKGKIRFGSTYNCPVKFQIRTARPAPERMSVDGIAPSRRRHLDANSAASKKLEDRVVRKRGDSRRSVG